VKRGVKGPLIDLKSVVGCYSDPPSHRIPVERLGGQGPQDKDVQRALKEGEGVGVHRSTVLFKVISVAQGKRGPEGSWLVSGSGIA
jgi:hypothetical protein